MTGIVGSLRNCCRKNLPQSWLSKVVSTKTLVLASLMMGVTSVDAKIIYVDKTAAKGGNGTSWAKAFKYLRDGLDASVPGDSIYVAKGVYYPDEGNNGIFGDREQSFEFNRENLKVYGGFDGTETKLSQRNVSANILLKLAHAYDLDLKSFASGESAASGFRKL